MFRSLIVAAALTLSAAYSMPAVAQDVSLTHKGLKLNAAQKLADGKSWKDGGVLLLHGTLAHNKMEIIAGLQDMLAERGINSLAPTLAMGITDRTGMYDCKVAHTHRNEDALDELAVWVDWMKKQGAANVTLAGHSRGGMQASWFAATNADPSIKRIVLIASGQWNKDKAAKGFKKTHKADLAPLLATAQAMSVAGKGADMLGGVGILYCPGADVSADSFISYYADNSQKDSPTTLKSVNRPVLVVTGTLDKVAAGLPERIRPMADGKKVSLVEVEEADHFFRDLFGEDVADAMQTFIEGGGS